MGITLFLFLGGASLIPVAYKAVTAPAVEQVVERPAAAPIARAEALVSALMLVVVSGLTWVVALEYCLR